MRLNRRGRNRWVLLTKRYAFKFPALYSWRSVLFGLLNNLNEAEWHTKPGACPVLWASPLGLVIVMPRLEPLTDAEFNALNVTEFNAQSGLRAEWKHDSFGKLGDTVLAVDYGW